MELSAEGVLKDSALNKNISTSIRYSNCDIPNEILDVTQISLENDEYWLYKLPGNRQTQVQDLKSWLYSNTNYIDEDLFSSTNSQNDQKIFDSRTFTRPKKRFTRPSIEKYNETVYGLRDNLQINSSRESISDCGVMSNEIISEVIKPLNFDLSQPSNSYYFENILANVKDSDSFQNMSPPSLVNSICSSTFANLMESSFIKNDPILREIRDTDFTQSILLQDSEAPMFQSITESCSSLNSDTPESFLKKVSRSDTFKKKSSTDLDKTIVIGDVSNNSQLNTTFELNTNNGSDALDEQKADDLDETIIQSKFCNDTFRRSTKKNTFIRSNNEKLNSTFNVPNENNEQNSTEQSLNITPKSRFIKRSLIRENTYEDLKKELNDILPLTDMNRLSYGHDEKNQHQEQQQHLLNRTVDIKRSSISTGSTDSLDRMSSVSNSSRGSNRMLSMADVDAIVEMQEKSLQQVMSTPKLTTAPKKFIMNNVISPITSLDNLSDSDVSSNEEYKSVKSSLSKGSLDTYIRKSADNVNYLGDSIMRGKPVPPPVYASAQNYRSNPSIPSSANSNIKGKPANVPVTNLKLMGQKLKSSYTSLKPMSTNLPVVPPITASNLNVTKTLTRTKKPNGSQNPENYTKIVEVHPMPREKSTSEQNIFVKPVNSRISCLPRPTGIPRPSSRIPAPRGGIRPTSSRSLSHKLDTNYK